MTTVGYGDKTPKSLIGRLFAVVWIFCGITINSIYVSQITAEIMASRNIKYPDMHGARVGALANRLYDSVMILQHGGSLKEIPYNSTVAGVVKMIRELDSETIDGFLLTKPTYYYYEREIKTLKHRHLAEIVKHVKRTTKHFVDEKLVAGMLVKKDEDYRFLREYFDNNWLQIQGCYVADLTYKHHAVMHTKTNAMSVLFVPFFTGMIHAAFTIVCFGIVYEVIQRRTLKLQAQMKEEYKDNEDDNEKTEIIKPI